LIKSARIRLNVWLAASDTSGRNAWIVALAIVGLYGRSIGVDHGHRRISAAENSGAELNAAGTIDLVADASLFEHPRLR
jgi:hypothetical protein